MVHYFTRSQGANFATQPLPLPEGPCKRTKTPQLHNDCIVYIKVTDMDTFVCMLRNSMQSRLYTELSSQNMLVNIWCCFLAGA